jgi:hypothetical protein
MSGLWRNPVVLGSVVLLALPGLVTSRPNFRKPAPGGVIEVVGALGRGWSLVELKDGSLMAVSRSQFRISNDDGATWSGTKPLPGNIGGTASGILRLKSGALAVYSDSHVWRSRDEGKTWDKGSPIKMLGTPYFATLIQLTNGRLIYPNRAIFAGEHPETPGGHTYKPEMDIGSISYSDDEGRTWKMCKGHLMGWFDNQGVVNGRGGVTPFDEPSAAQTADGRVLCFARSTVGRIVATYSRDAGVTWSAVRPTKLMASYSPCRLVRIPETGDLLCVWNQVSRAEIRGAYRRSRLSVAISSDSGRSWKNFKTLEVSAGLEDLDYIAPEFPIQHVGGGWSDVDVLDGFSWFRYMNVCFAKDKVYVMYVRQWLEGPGKLDLGVQEDAQVSKTARKKASEQVLRIYPLKYFYEP